MTITSGQPGPTPDMRNRRLGQVAELDSQILKLLSKRASALAREAEWRRSQGKPGNDHAMEKDLFNLWTTTGRQLGLNRQLLRQLFNLVRLFVPSRPQTEDSGSKAYGLAPRHEKLAIRLPGPRSLAATRAWTVLAAATNRDFSLTPVILNDPLVDLVHALNQAGAHCTRLEGLVKHQSAGARALARSMDAETLPEAFITHQNASTPSLHFDGKTISTGGDPFNLCTLLALALGGAGHVVFTGVRTLELLDISLFNAILPRLGARIVPLNPRSSGLPARLEFGGEMAAEVELPETTPPYFAAALALAAWSYPRGLRLTFTDGFPMRAALAPTVHILNTAGVQARLELGQCLVPHAAPCLPLETDAPLDPVLSAYLLAMPAFVGGRCELSGRLDPADPTAAFMLKHLDALGLDVRRTDSQVSSQAIKDVPEQKIILGQVPELFPLALAFALHTRRPMTVQPSDEESFNELGEEFLTRLGADFNRESGEFQIRPGQLTWDTPWSCPTPHFALGLALAAFVHPGLTLENPGVLTALWPQFFSIYHGLPTGQPRPKPVAEELRAPVKRRIRV